MIHKIKGMGNGRWSVYIAGDIEKYETFIEEKNVSTHIIGLTCD